MTRNFVFVGSDGGNRIFKAVIGAGSYDRACVLWRRQTVLPAWVISGEVQEVTARGDILQHRKVYSRMLLEKA